MWPIEKIGSNLFHDWNKQFTEAWGGSLPPVLSAFPHLSVTDGSYFPGLPFLSSGVFPEEVCLHIPQAGVKRRNELWQYEVGPSLSQPSVLKYYHLCHDTVHQGKVRKGHTELAQSLRRVWENRVVLLLWCLRINDLNKLTCLCVFKKWGQMGKMYSFWDLKTRRVLSEPHQHRGTPLVISTFSDTPRNLRTIKRNVLICQDLRPPHSPQRNPFPILCQRSAQREPSNAQFLSKPKDRVGVSVFLRTRASSVFKGGRACYSSRVYMIPVKCHRVLRCKICVNLGISINLKPSVVAGFVS